MPILLFDWIESNAESFLQRWEAKKEKLGDLYPSIEHPKDLPHFTRLLLEEFTRDIDGANVMGHSIIHCDSYTASHQVTNRMGLFESQPWVITVMEGELHECGKLADLFVTVNVDETEPLKLLGKLF